jgi:dimethylhistidine N-methyltransferase
MAQRLGPRCHLIEYGTGAGVKTRLLLEQLAEPVAYVPVDMSLEYLRRSAEALAAEFPDIEVTPLCADFTQAVRAPEPRRHASARVVYFPGSTIGNFTPDETVVLLRRTAALCGRGGGMLLGLDLQKDPKVIEAAYNDACGVTAAFNLNLLVRINRELHADFPVHEFSHRAVYQRRERRIEMYLDSRRDQRVRLGDDVYLFRAGEPIRTEYSYKFDVQDFAKLARSAGFTPQDVWTDDRKYFAVVYLSVS